MNDRTTQVLARLRQADGYLSGEDLCERLGVSRTAVWKHIKQLREHGYTIDSASNRGYHLVSAPNTPLPFEVNPLLTTKRVGRTFHYLEETDSTNRVASQLASEGAPEGTVVVADTQSAGRGRMQRVWFSPPGQNLYLSIVLRPQVLPLQVPQISLVVGISLCRTIARMFPTLKPQAKWPNDIFFGGRKLAGILCSMVAEMERVQHIVVGIGINVNVADFPPEIKEAATSLRLEGGEEVSRPAFLAALLGDLEKAYDQWLEQGLPSFLDEWNTVSLLTGRTVTVETLGQEVRGLVTGVSQTGTLILQLADGITKEIVGGDVHVAKF